MTRTRPKKLTDWDGYIVGVRVTLPDSPKEGLALFDARVDLVPSSGDHIELDLGDKQVRRFEVVRVVHTLERSGNPGGHDWGFTARSVTLVVRETDTPDRSDGPSSTYARR